MKTSESQEDYALNAIAEKLAEASQELEELAVQLSLGKADVKDKYEEIKKDFRKRVNEFRVIVAAEPQKSASVALMAMIIELETALLSGRVDATKVFEDQKKAILGTIALIEDEILKRFGKIPAVHNFIHETEKFKLKLEILRLKFVLKKFKVKDTFRTGMAEAVDIVRKAQSGVRKVKDQYRNFRDEASLAYSHLKKAVKKI